MKRFLLASLVDKSLVVAEERGADARICAHDLGDAHDVGTGGEEPTVTDANLATGVQPFPRPILEERWMNSAIDQDAVPPGVGPFIPAEIMLANSWLTGAPSVVQRFRLHEDVA